LHEKKWGYSQAGKALDCNSTIAGSNPAGPSNLFAGVVQRLVRGLAKAETGVRFSSLAPLVNLFELFRTLYIEINQKWLIFLLVKPSVSLGRLTHYKESS
jgi:hypothetical protein